MPYSPHPDDERRTTAVRSKRKPALFGHTKSSESRRKQWLIRVGIASVALPLCAIIGFFGTLIYYSRGLPTAASLQQFAPPQTTQLLDRNGKLLGRMYTERRTVVPMAKIPRVLVLSVLAAEDADFYRHQGLDYPGILRAVYRGLVHGRATQGASTITQQVVKNVLLSPERTIARKMRELILARRIEQELTKDEILHLYLNFINFGHGRYGVQEASRFYFGKDVNHIDLAEAALLAGIPKSPTRLSPRAHPEAAKARQRFVLGQLQSKRAEYWPDLTETQIEQARTQPIQLAASLEPEEAAPELASIVRELLRSRVGADETRRGGFTVHTTLDLDMQRAARQALRRGLERLDQRNGLRAPLQVAPKKHAAPDVGPAALQTGKTYDAVVTGADDASQQLFLTVYGTPAVADVSQSKRFNPKDLPASKVAPQGTRVRVSVETLPTATQRSGRARVRLELGPEGAVVLLDNSTREIRAMVGGYESTPGFNRALSAVRQPGSTFKGVVYALGIKSRRFTPASIVIDAPEVFDKWKPRNFETWNYQGSVRLREALAKSINLVAVRVIQEVTPVEVVEFAKSLGIKSKLDPSLALALGASDVKPIELANAYATFAASGEWAPPRLITKITTSTGAEVPLPEPEARRQVMTAAEAYVITSMLTSVVREGTAVAAGQLGRPAAGKTGTSNDARDAWFVGYTGTHTAGVWVGYDDRRPLGRKESGARSALPIWIELMKAAERGVPETPFTVPEGVVTVRIDPVTGLLAYEGMPNAIDEVFLEGTAPTEVAHSPDIADTNTFLMEQMGGAGNSSESNSPPASE